MVLGKLPVPGRPTIWKTVGQGPAALAVGAGGGCLDIFTVIYPFSSLSPSLWETARYRLKYRLKGSLNPKQPTNQRDGSRYLGLFWKEKTLSNDRRSTVFVFFIAKELPPVEKAPRPERRERSRISRPRRVPAKVKTSSGEEITHWLIRSDPDTRIHRPDYGLKVFDQTKPTVGTVELQCLEH